MAGLRGKSGPPGNMNAFKHGLAAIQKRREESVITEHEESVRLSLPLPFRATVTALNRDEIQMLNASRLYNTVGSHCRL